MLDKKSVKMIRKSDSFVASIYVEMTNVQRKSRLVSHNGKAWQYLGKIGAVDDGEFVRRKRSEPVFDYYYVPCIVRNRKDMFSFYQ